MGKISCEEGKGIEAVWKNINGEKRKRTEISWKKIKIKMKGDGGSISSCMELYPPLFLNNVSIYSIFILPDKLLLNVIAFFI